MEPTRKYPATTRCLHLLIPFFSLLLLSTATTTTAAAAGGRWQLLKSSIGVSAMHMQLLHNDRVVIFDRTDFGPSNLTLPRGRCRDDPYEQVLKHDCTAHSAEYDVLTDTVRPLMIQTDTWCSSGSVDAYGTLIQTGGYNDGERTVRTFRPCPACDWREYNSSLSFRRWYSSNSLLPDGRQILIGGRRAFSYEFYPKRSRDDLFMFPLLRVTHEFVENNLYPFVHMNVDGNLFVYANNQSVLLDYRRNVVVKTFPVMPGGDPRNYPSSGSSVMLPLGPAGDEAEVLICGGAIRGAYELAQNHTFLKALNTCGRIKITDLNPEWTMETMPMGRVMGDMVILPTGDVLIINGAGSGTAGWESAEDPVLSPVIYRPNNPAGSRFEVQSPTTIPRLYHSTAILLRDGRVLVGGSNPHVDYSFYGRKYPTDLSLEAFYPEYLSETNSGCRPKIVTPNSTSGSCLLRFGQRFTVEFTMPTGSRLRDGAVKVTVVRPPFTTHAYSMNQRVLLLEIGDVVETGPGSYQVDAVAPKSAVLAPAGHYMLFVVNGEIPSEGAWVRIV